MKDIIANNQVSTQQHKMDNYSNSMRGQSKTIGYSGIGMGRLAHRTTRANLTNMQSITSLTMTYTNIY